MKERPILFNGEMVRAILDGRKTQTRRIVAEKLLQHTYDCAMNPTTSLRGTPLCPIQDPGGSPGQMIQYPKQEAIESCCPFGKPGDFLWIRETWKPDPSWGQGQVRTPLLSEGDNILYKSTLPENHAKASWCNWRPSIHMPRWASRITLKIANVRMERLNEISEDDAWAEGCQQGNPALPGMEGWDCAKDWYADLWESINGKGSWDLNPYVWGIEFKRVEVGK
jgi:hypothetical protein